jgi:hypothetical protein
MSLDGSPTVNWLLRERRRKPAEDRSMFADATLAARIDRAEARLCAGVATFVGASRPHLGSMVIPINGGLAVYVSPSSPVNKVVGLALDGALDLDGSKRSGGSRGSPFVSSCRS